jgi:hypothetical protein
MAAAILKIEVNPNPVSSNLVSRIPERLDIHAIVDTSVPYTLPYGTPYVNLFKAKPEVTVSSPKQHTETEQGDMGIDSGFEAAGLDDSPAQYL